MRVHPVSILHMGHSFRGGIPINARGQTSLQGLYAAGEVSAGYYAAESSWGPFPSSLITGAIAGRSVAADLRQAKRPTDNKNIKDGLEQIQALTKKEGKQRAAALQDEIRQICYRSAGPVRSEPLIEAGLKDLIPLEDAAQYLRCESIAELKQVLETKAMLSIGRALLEATLLRKESRGAHYRKDFPTRDDRNWLRPVLVSYDAVGQQIKVEAGKDISPAKGG